MRNGLGSFHTIMTGTMQCAALKMKTAEKSPPSSWTWARKYCEKPLVSRELRNPVAIPSIFNFWGKKAYVYQSAPSKWNRMKYSVHFLRKTAKSFWNGKNSKYKWILEIRIQVSYLHTHTYSMSTSKSESNTSHQHHLLISWFMHSYTWISCGIPKNYFRKKIRICLHFPVWLNEVKATENQILLFSFRKKILFAQHLFIQCAHFDVINSAK